MSYELIPNLVESAKSYMKHKRKTLATVIQARNRAAGAAAAVNWYTVSAIVVGIVVNIIACLDRGKLR